MSAATSTLTQSTMGETLASRPEYHLDYALWQADDPTSTKSRTFVDNLRKAMVGIGFFYLNNTPLEAQRKSMFDLVECFFALPLQTRLMIDMNKSPHFRGYCKFGDETTASLPDLRDQVDYGPHEPTLPAKYSSLLDQNKFLNLCGPNQFLSDDVCEGHERIVTKWFDTASEISFQLTRALEQALGVPENQMMQYLTGTTTSDLEPIPYSRMKTIRYPTGASVDGISRDAKSQQGVGAHKDSGWLTLLTPSAVPGLQVQDFDGTWLAVPPNGSATIVNFGQQIEYLSHGIVQAATHRVVSAPESTTPRYSIAFFSSPALNVRLSPLDKTTFDKATTDLWQKAEQQRQGKDIISDVPKGDLFAKHDEHFGWINWRGLTRSHPGVVKAFYQ